MAWVLLEHVESQIIVCTIWRCGCSLWLSNQNDCQRVKATHRLIPAGINLQILLFRVAKKSKVSVYGYRNLKLKLRAAKALPFIDLQKINFLLNHFTAGEGVDATVADINF